MQLKEYEKQHNAALRSYGGECCVLLKSNGDFPLKEAGRIALYGSGARQTIKGGTGSGEVNSRFFVTIEEGLENAGFQITTRSWLNAYDRVREEARKKFIQEIKARAKKNHTMAVIEGMGAVMPEPAYVLPLDGEGDVAVYVLSRISGEGSDREPVEGDILLSPTERRDILALQEKYEKFLLVLNVGGPVDLSSVEDKVDNILLLSQLGVMTGDIFADLLLGKSYPSGKLTTTWSKWEDYADLGEFGDINDTRYREGVYVGYRYFDTVGKKAAHPFGFGLSYTKFEINAGNIASEGETVTVTAHVTNTGNRPGKEVAQLYVSSPEGRLDKPYQALAAWAKTEELEPGASQTLELSFRLSDLASFDGPQSCFVCEKGDYILRLGDSSADTRAVGILRLGEEAAVRKVKACLGTPDFQDWKPGKVVWASDSNVAISVSDSVAVPESGLPATAPKDGLSGGVVEASGSIAAPESGSAATASKDGLSGGTAGASPIPVLEISASDLPSVTVSYDTSAEIDPAVEKLSDEQLAYMNVGAFDPKGGAMSVIGSASSHVAGAAGETTGQLKEQGFPVLVMSDGPAGLRLSKQFTRDEKGVHPVGETMPATILEFMPKPVAWLMSLMNPKPKAGQTIYEQYATAIPIGTAIAQSWNLEFAEKCGDLVGDEMERFGVHLWLAPALNIHRSIRCGRNFEYFSEDPLISGKFAAAITRGVQKHPGRGTTVKHYAANNQETNRYNNNSQVSERAMREIYLKGFEICVKESQPHALMTSYNLLNGEHTSERRDLIEDILRSEFGYQGIVMTDWVVNGGTMNKASIHPAPNAVKVAAAGGDLFMPGGKGDFQNILTALENGQLSRTQLQINATRVYRMAKKLTEES